MRGAGSVALTIAVDPATLHFFDPETETALR
jgi:hypothetical protein